MAFPPYPPSQQPSRGPQQRPPRPKRSPGIPKRVAYFWYSSNRILRENQLLRTLVLFLSLSIVLIFLVGLGLKLYTRHGQKFIVPTFVGTNFEQAQRLAKEGDLRLEIIDSLYMPKQPPGMILDQSPKSGMGVKSGRRGFLIINAFRPKTAVIPHVTGLSLRQAKNILENKGFEIERLIYRSDMATNNVLEERYQDQVILNGNTLEAELGSSITLTVGVKQDAPLPQVPKVIGLTLREAKSRLWEVGLNLGNMKYDLDVPADRHEEARVYRQEPNLLSRSDYGGKIALWFTLDPSKISTSEKESEERSRTVAPDQEEESEEESIEGQE